MNDIGFLGQDHSGQSQDKPPEVSRFSRGRDPENSPESDNQKQDHPGFVNRVAIVKNKTGRNRHAERGQIADDPTEEWSKEKNPENGNQTCQNDRKPQRPEITAEQL